MIGQAVGQTSSTNLTRRSLFFLPNW